MNALVLGYGRSGKAAETLLCRSGFSVTVLDGEAAFPEGSFDVAVVSPGIALTHPWIIEAKRRGIPLKSELQLGCEELRWQGWKLLAVTGSKGKSSVVKIVADAIGGVPCGNYGLPVCEVACRDRNVATPLAGTDSEGPRHSCRGNGIIPSPRFYSENSATEKTSCQLPHWNQRGCACFATWRGAATFLSRQTHWAVVEVSSFMMETTELPSDAFEAAAILNLQEDHLDRHGSVAVYHGLKRKLLTFAVKNFVNEGMSSEHPSIGASEHLWKNSYFDNEILAGNAAVAVELMRVAGLDDAAIVAAFKAFQPLPHRMNLVAKLGGVRYIDDSKATSIAALVAGVKMASARPVPCSLLPVPSILLIAGGLPKGDDPKTALPVLTGRVRKVYLIGQSAAAFYAAWTDAVDCEICGTMDRAVECAKREAEKGETVLLSPGTASFDQFQSFGERGDVFAGLVQEKDKTNE